MGWGGGECVHFGNLFPNLPHSWTCSGAECQLVVDRRLSSDVDSRFAVPIRRSGSAIPPISCYSKWQLTTELLLCVRHPPTPYPSSHTPPIQHTHTHHDVVENKNQGAKNILCRDQQNPQPLPPRPPHHKPPPSPHPPAPLLLIIHPSSTQTSLLNPPHNVPQAPLSFPYPSWPTQFFCIISPFHRNKKRFFQFSRIRSRHKTFRTLTVVWA